MSGAVGAGVGFAVGTAVGLAVGAAVGTAVGVAVGAVVGAAVGAVVGTAVGAAVGAAVGTAVGAAVGVALGAGVLALGQGWPEGLSSMIHISTFPPPDTEAGQGVGCAAEPPFPAVSLGAGVALVLQGGVFTMYQPEKLNCEVGLLAARAVLAVNKTISKRTAAICLRFMRHLLIVTTLCRLSNDIVI